MALIDQAEITAIRGAEQATKPSTPAAGYRKIFAKNNGWYDENSAGVETRIGEGTTPGAHTHGGGDVTSAVANATNADMVDGSHAAAFATAGHDHSDASTSAHGFAPTATAPAAGLRNVVALDNAETAYTNKALFDATNPANLGTAAPGTAMVAARRDHVHEAPAGNVVGPATNTDAGIPQWNGANSKTLKDGLALVAAVGDPGADTSVPTEQAVREGLTAQPGCITFIISGVVAVGAGVIRLHAPRAGAITSVLATVSTAPTGADLIVDVHKNGTTIFTTQANRPTIAATTQDDLTSTPDVTAFAANDVFTMDVDQTGATVAGSNLVVQVRYTGA